MQCVGYENPDWRTKSCEDELWIWPEAKEMVVGKAFHVAENPVCAPRSVKSGVNRHRTEVYPNVEWSIIRTAVKFSTMTRDHFTE